MVFTASPAPNLLKCPFLKTHLRGEKNEKTAYTMRERKKDAGSWTRKRAYKNEREDDGNKEKDKKGTKQMERGRRNGREGQISTKPRKNENIRK